MTTIYPYIHCTDAIYLSWVILLQAFTELTFEWHVTLFFNGMLLYLCMLVLVNDEVHSTYKFDEQPVQLGAIPFSDMRIEARKIPIRPRLLL